MANATLIWPGKTNGKIPLALMRQALPGKYLQPDAAVAFERMNAALLKATGKRLTANSAQDFYRDIAKQEELFAAHQKNPKTTASAANPGTSNHGFGLAADVTGMTDPTIVKWMNANAANYSWRIFRITGEPWHIEYIGPITSLAGEGEPEKITTGENTMPEAVQFYERVEPGYPQEWSRMGETIPGGWEATLDGILARQWGRQYSGEGTVPVHVDRATYIAAQNYWKTQNSFWESRERSRISAVVGPMLAGVNGTVVNNPPVDIPALVKLVVASMPTAEDIAIAVNNDAANRMRE